MNLLDALIGTVAAPVKATGKVLSGENPLPEVMEGLSNFGTVLGTPGAMVTSAIAGENPLEAGLFDTDKRVGGRGLLERYKLAGENTDQGWFPDWGDAGGFAIDMVADPMNWIGGGLLKRLIGSAGKAKTANKLIKEGSSLPRVMDIGEPVWKIPREEFINGRGETASNFFDVLKSNIQDQDWLNREGITPVVSRDAKGDVLAAATLHPDRGVLHFGRDLTRGPSSQNAAMAVLKELQPRQFPLDIGELSDDSASLLHRIYVDEAVRRGQDVPLDVLADYPKAGKSKYLQQVIPVPPLEHVASPNSLLALLGGHNALAHTRFQGDDQ